MTPIQGSKPHRNLGNKEGNEDTERSWSGSQSSEDDRAKKLADDMRRDVGICLGLDQVQDNVD